MSHMPHSATCIMGTRPIAMLPDPYRDYGDFGIVRIVSDLTAYIDAAPGDVIMMTEGAGGGTISTVAFIFFQFTPAPRDSPHTIPVAIRCATRSGSRMCL